MSGTGERLAVPDRIPRLRPHDLVSIAGLVAGLGSLVIVSLALTAPSGCATPECGSGAAGQPAGEVTAATSAEPHEPLPTPDLFEGPSFGLEPPVRPTVEKPQSKLWFHDGTWWGTLLHERSQGFRIHRLDRESQRWDDTKTVVDERAVAHLDVLAVDEVVYVAGAGPTAYAGQAARLTRLRYDAEARAYRVDEGYPVSITSRGVRSLVVARDGASWLWAVFISDGLVRVAHTEGDDAVWSAPVAIDVPGADRSAGAVSVIAVDGTIQVLWSSDDEDAVYIATHRDGDPADDWRGVRTVVDGVQQADDHLNLKAVELDDGWHLFAALKTSLDDSPRANPLDPQIQVLEVHPDGTTTIHLAGRIRDRHTRSIILIDEEARRIYLAATWPASGGRIQLKSSSLDRISFPSGRGDVLLRSRTAELLNDPTSTKQNLDSETDLVVVAADATVGRYVTGVVDLGAPEDAEP